MCVGACGCVWVGVLQRKREREGGGQSDHVDAESASFLSFFDRFVHVTEFERLTMGFSNRFNSEIWI